jgi:UDP-2,4-diacetamido-2,4,6-trideoxy-beta-L-altropyranose hydrolase
MKVLFRTDASDVIGTGHLMRCLTLARELKWRGSHISFVSRDLSPSAIKKIKDDGFLFHQLKTRSCDHFRKAKHLAHADWLPVSQEQDANETLLTFLDFKPDWVIVDHYALDEIWHRILKKYFAKILVIDDLGDRNLNCDILLDQNLGANSLKYKDKVKKNCTLLLGPKFSLLRDEFKIWRNKSLNQRMNQNPKNVLISMGGSDLNNYTMNILQNISKSKFAAKCRFTVIVGEYYPYVNTLQKFVISSELKLNVLSNVDNMAEIMSNMDLCIGAAGSTTWERCCLGLPSITLAIAENQTEILSDLVKKQITVASRLDDICQNFDRLAGDKQSDELVNLSKSSALLCDGYGVNRICDELEHMIGLNAY